MGMYIQYSLMLFKAKIEVKLILGKEKKKTMKHILILNFLLGAEGR